MTYTYKYPHPAVTVNALVFYQSESTTKVAPGVAEDNSLVILNAADEVAIDYFLKRRIEFTDIYKVMAYIFQHYKSSKIKKIEDVFFWDGWARAKTKEYLKKL